MTLTIILEKFQTAFKPKAVNTDVEEVFRILNKAQDNLRQTKGYILIAADGHCRSSKDYQLAYEFGESFKDILKKSPDLTKIEELQETYNSKAYSIFATQREKDSSYLKQAQEILEEIGAKFAEKIPNIQSVIEKGEYSELKLKDGKSKPPVPEEISKILEHYNSENTNLKSQVAEIATKHEIKSSQSGLAS